MTPPSIKEQTVTPIAEGNKPPPPPFKSFGYKAHNEFTYRGIDWLLNSSLAVGATYIADRTAVGQKWFSRPVANTFEAIARPMFKNEAWVKSAGRGGTMFTSIMAGGTLIIPVMMALENKDVKKAFIHKVDEITYGKDAVASDARFKEQDTLIDNEPKKDFNTGMKARLAALAPLMAMTFYPGTNEPLQENVYENIGKISKSAAKGLGLESKKLLEKGAFEEMKNGSKKWVNDWDFIHKTIGFDISLTLLYSYVHEMAYKAFAKHQQWHKDHTHGDNDTHSHSEHVLMSKDQPCPLESKESFSAQNEPLETSQWQDKVGKRSNSPDGPKANDRSGITPSESHQAYLTSTQESEQAQTTAI